MNTSGPPNVNQTDVGEPTGFTSSSILGQAGVGEPTSELNDSGPNGAEEVMPSSRSVRFQLPPRWKGIIPRKHTLQRNPSAHQEPHTQPPVASSSNTFIRKRSTPFDQESTIPAPPHPGSAPHRRSRELSETPRSDVPSKGKERESAGERVTKVQLVERDTLQVMEQFGQQVAVIGQLTKEVSRENMQFFSPQH